MRNGRSLKLRSATSHAFLNSAFRTPHSAFILLEVVIAIGVFMVAITGIVVALNAIIDSSLAVRKENTILVKMETRLAEARFLPLQEGTFPDEEPDTEGVLFTRVVTPLEMENKDAVPLGNLFKVQIVATWQDGIRKESQTAEIYVLQR
jgi:hypothetical protein